MTERQTYKALKLIQKRTMNVNKHKLICQSLVNNGLATCNAPDGKGDFELTIKGKITIWDYENWKLTS
jgi:predicted transcriptional regulator